MAQPSAFDLRCRTRGDEVGGKRCLGLHRKVVVKKQNLPESQLMALAVAMLTWVFG